MLPICPVNVLLHLSDIMTVFAALIDPMIISLRFIDHSLMADLLKLCLPYRPSVLRGRARPKSLEERLLPCQFVQQGLL